jgi:type II secretory pathway pseudopilin PulG
MNSGIIVAFVIVAIGAAALVYLELNSRRNARQKESEDEESR